MRSRHVRRRGMGLAAHRHGREDRSGAVCVGLPAVGRDLAAVEMPPGLNGQGADMSTALHEHNLKKNILAVSIVGFAVVLGSAIALGSSSKWTLAIAVFAAVLPLMVRAMRSLEKPLFLGLVFFMATPYDINPWIRRGYGNTVLEPGITIKITAVFLAALVFIWISRVLWRKTAVDWFAPVMLPLGVLVAWGIFSLTFATYPEFTADRIPGLLTSFFLVLFMANYIDSAEKARFVMTCMALTAGFSGLLAILQYVTVAVLGLNILGSPEDFWVVGSEMIRARGLMGHPNDLGLIFVGMLPALGLFGVARLEPRFKALCLGAFILGFIALLTTLSRGSWIGFFLAIMVIIALSQRSFSRRRLRGAFVMLAILIPLLGMMAAPFAGTIVNRLSSDESDAAQSRIPLAKSALKVIQANPVEGVGLGNYKQVVLEYDPGVMIGGEDDGPLAAHNMLLYLAAELGIPALVLFLFACTSLFFKGLRGIRTRLAEINLLCLGTFAGLAGIFASSMFEDVSFGGTRFQYMCFLAGIVLGCSRFARYGGAERSVRRP
ncbi:O-antigen ligase family protein [Oceanidesulfovibrio marinus]|uniref:O-antigen ligase family protein n=1 Tax=Oceanidesulfovibrio marinus TaxID=370038 RepID=A0ABX6NAX3_9BACT|nr:O-antigen ligase family protein [Oceanidesulfovibrio marinus]